MNQGCFQVFDLLQFQKALKISKPLNKSLWSCVAFIIDHPGQPIIKLWKIMRWYELGGAFTPLRRHKITLHLEIIF
jgi:hypothetical protein